ncbi:glutathione transferase [Durotheca rogersii]|uniref:glutathione transferase n=1 Tax=Durotheca rogersii TaxID=419775 RepID=UPI00221FFB6B|nr:glutathione transferase [Durotheca rogersii]KAI5861283.1 glutathione transferase [Durotheca rogersii]
MEEKLLLPIKVYNAPHGQGPNPWKVIIVLAELGLPYEIAWIPYGEMKSEPYTLLNPNGRVPAMVDPNRGGAGGVTLWESGAIINYLIATYDREGRLRYGDDRLEEKWLLQSWLMFQMSGQGPMFGQKVWFTHLHIEPNLRTAIDRYGNEAKRIMGVVEATLRKQRQKLQAEQQAEETPVWLVGDKCTYADLAFVPWNTLLDTVFPRSDAGMTLDLAREFPEYNRWHRNMAARPAVRGVLAHREECIRTMTNTSFQVVERQADAAKLPEYEPSVGVGGN